MPDEFPWYLILPFAASVLFACGLIVIKKATQVGASSWAVTFVANFWAALFFSALWPLGGASEPLAKLWQPGVVGLIYVAGQICTFLAINRGDVSVAAPVFGVKVLLVAILLTTVEGETLSWQVWLAAISAAVGVALIQRTGGAAHQHRVVASVLFALSAASCFALFDILVQRWAPAWGPGRLLPLSFWFAGLLTLALLPLLDLRGFRNRRTLGPIMLGGFLIALQAVCIVLTVAFFGDAARVNIVYSLRGIWGVGLAFLFAHWLGAGEMHVTHRVMMSRLVGAVFVTLAVVVAIASRSH